VEQDNIENSKIWDK